MDRRQFLKFSSFLTTTAITGNLAGCLSSGGGDDEVPDASGSSWKFPQSVASADPKPDSIILWTRVVGSSQSDVETTADDNDVKIRLIVTAVDNSGLLGTNTALTGTALLDTKVTAYGAYDSTIRHKLTGLSAGTTYYYQFVAGSVRSKVGRFKTAPATTAEVSQLKFAFITCQDWTINHWAGYQHIVDNEEIDFFLHLGDYIYETVGEDFQTGAVESRHTTLTLPDGVYKSGNSGAKYASTLNDYRYLYKTYRTDSRLQAMHERFAMIAIWDDHEFSDDCWQDAETYDVGTYNSSTGAGDNTRQTSRRLHANRAWYEFIPADISFDSASTSINGIQIYRDFQFGQLAHLVMTDERLYRADHMIPEALIGSSTGSRYMVPASYRTSFESAKIAAATTAGLADTLSPVSMLGTTQRAWWKTKMSSATTTWKLWGNEVSLLRMGLNGTNAIATLVALNSVSTLVTNITNTVSGYSVSVEVASAIIAAVTAGATSANAQAGAVAIATADATSADKQTAAVNAGLTAAQAAIAVSAYSSAKAVSSSGTSVAATAAAQVIAFGYIKVDIRTNGASSSFVSSLGLDNYFTKFLLNCDQWDGYNAERQQLMNYLIDNNISNVVALTGDIHAFFAGTVSNDFDATGGGTAAMVDLVTAGMSSDSFFTYLSDAVGSLSSSLATLVYYTLSIPTGTPYGTLSVNFNLLDYTLGRAAPTVAQLAEQVRVQVRGALAKAGAAENSLDTLTTAILTALQADSAFNTSLLALAQQLASLDSNPWLKYVCTDAQGYSLVTLTPNQLVCEFRQVNRLVGTTAPSTSVITRTTTATVPAGSAAVTIS